MADKRSEQRNTCYLRAEITIGHNTPPIQAEAHDISDHGMRLVVLNTRNLPDTFIVSIPRRHFREVVEVRRRNEKELGVVIKNVIEHAVRRQARG